MGAVSEAVRAAQRAGARKGNASRLREYEDGLAFARAWLSGRISALALGKLGFCPAEVDQLLRLRARVRRALPRIQGMDLICWCPVNSRWCHADTLLHLANGGPE